MPYERRRARPQRPRLGDALAAAEAEGLNPEAVAAVRLLLTTGCRRGEVLRLRRSYLD